MKNDALPVMNIGLIGHVDHGKTTLTSALSGKWTDTHSEELKRGITIKLGYADIEIRKDKKGNFTNESKVDGKETELIRKISLVDAPGHETLMAVMISGAAIMDGAILMVAANEECPQPQTREHLTVLKILGIKNIIVVQNKVDLVKQADAKKHYKQVEKFVTDTLGFEVPIIPMSAQKGANLDILIEAIEEFMPTPKEKEKADSSFIVARSFDINEFEEKGLISKFVQSSISYNKTKGTVRGMHYQVKPFQEGKLVRCTRGSVFEVLLDIRPQSKTFLTWISVELSANNYNMVYVPKGVILGFQTLEDNTELIYQMTEYYTPEFQRGMKWNDSTFNIDWPLEMTVISKRDASFSKFEYTTNKKDYFYLE